MRKKVGSPLSPTLFSSVPFTFNDHTEGGLYFLASVAAVYGHVAKVTMQVRILYSGMFYTMCVCVVYLCMYFCLCTCVRYLCMHVCGGQESTSGVSYPSPP